MIENIMFSWINKQGVRNSDRFEVQCTGRFTMEYREGARRLIIDIESAGEGMIAFDLKSFEKWANSSVKNSLEEQKCIFNNFMAALEFQGLSGMP